MTKPRAREVFSNDLEDAKGSSKFPDIDDINHGADHGSVSFKYLSDTLPLGGVTIQALVPELSDYPKSHEYMLYTDDENVPPTFANSLENIQVSLKGLSLSEMFNKVSRYLGKLPQADALPGSEPDSDEDLMDEEEDYDFDDDEAWSGESLQQQDQDKNRLGTVEQSLSASKTQKSQILSDLRKVKLAGFKVGIIGDVLANAYLAISVRVRKLGISDEALQAWNVDRRQYLVLLIHHPRGYRDTSQMSLDDKDRKSGVEMRVGLCQSYKPSRTATVQAFTKTVKNATSSASQPEYIPQGNEDDHKFHLMFLSQSLRGLLNERLFKILQYRLSFGFGWGGAELFYNDHQCKPLPRDIIDAKYYEEDQSSSLHTLSEYVLADHLTEAQEQASFPLVAMQFVLRHFVRCTEFCLVCHCKVKADFEALKPYVCDNRLCLYQYMSLGFGPSIEWEVISQPYVVDLLISFCYKSARTGRLNDYPSGLHLQVPPQLSIMEDLNTYGTSGAASAFMISGYIQKKPPQPSPSDKAHGSFTSSRLSAKFDTTNLELVFSDATAKCPLAEGNWIAIQDPHDGNREMHCRVMEVLLFPTVKVGKPVIRGTYPTAGLVLDNDLGVGPGHGLVDVKFHKYDQNFDELPPAAKNQAIWQILETLPDVRQMKTYLLQSQKHRAEPSLSHWNERISTTALNLLRWIIASNRSCLLQVDDMDGTDKDVLKVASSVAEDRVYGMGQWMQFRFAQGAPDKEQRFIDAVRSTAERLKLEHPTFFAFHGSPLQNWHGIVREGLHFKDTLHGRACGHGVYLSLFAETSKTYSTMHSHDTKPNWPHSKLQMTAALALNEVVNAPEEFVHRQSHHVVDKLDWIQTRYLFVQCSATDRPLLPEKVPLDAFQQDPRHPLIGESGKKVVIPITAVSKCRRSAVSPSSSRDETEHKRRKLEKEINADQAQQEDDDASSIVTTFSDRGFFIASDDEDDEDMREIGKKEFEQRTNTAQKSPPQTDFAENSLDITTLPMLVAPSYANPMASKALQRALQETLNVQKSTPLHELGWYINPDHINNLYQWIVELHSFDPKLPLSADMKAKGVNSIVLELRFTSNYPFAPPFVRVIRPRFLPFLQGGGGHVTAGGALCMELLTSSGWSAVNNIESVLLQVRMAISSTDPKPAKLEARGRDYGIGEAVNAFVRACRIHNWTVPEGFTNLNREVPNPAGGSYMGLV